jgi:orotate phosphoribosyltransferase
VADLHERIVQLVTSHAYQRRAEPFRLASGQLSHDYIDGKLAIAHGDDLCWVADAVIASVSSSFDSVGGLTMGADAIAHAVAMRASCRWFSVRKQPKGRGLDKWIEGAALHSGVSVLLVDDVVTTGGSILMAYEKVRATGAPVVAAVTLVDRGDTASAEFGKLGIQYESLVNYTDLGIERIGPARPAPLRV